MRQKMRKARSVRIPLSQFNLTMRALEAAERALRGAGDNAPRFALTLVSAAADDLETAGINADESVPRPIGNLFEEEERRIGPAPS